MSRPLTRHQMEHSEEHLSDAMLPQESGTSSKKYSSYMSYPLKNMSRYSQRSIPKESSRYSNNYHQYSDYKQSDTYKKSERIADSDYEKFLKQRYPDLVDSHKESTVSRNVENGSSLVESKKSVRSKLKVSVIVIILNLCIKRIFV